MRGRGPRPSPAAVRRARGKVRLLRTSPPRASLIALLNPAVFSTAEAPPEASPRGPERPHDWAWADLMRRVFELDVLACPRCGGRMAVIATIEAGDVMRKILGHLGLPTKPPSPLPARPPPLAGGLFS